MTEEVQPLTDREYSLRIAQLIAEGILIDDDEWAVRVAAWVADFEAAGGRLVVDPSRNYIVASKAAALLLGLSSRTHVCDLLDAGVIEYTLRPPWRGYRAIETMTLRAFIAKYERKGAEGNG